MMIAWNPTSWIFENYYKTKSKLQEFNSESTQWKPEQKPNTQKRNSQKLQNNSTRRKILKTRLLYSNLDLRVETLTWLTKFQTMTITSSSKTMWILTVTLNGSSSQWKTLEDLWEKWNSIFSTWPNLIPYTTTAWKFYVSQKRTKKHKVANGSEEEATSLITKIAFAKATMPAKSAITTLSPLLINSNMTKIKFSLRIRCLTPIPICVMTCPWFNLISRRIMCLEILSVGH